jgi:regulator of sigma E protease
MASTDQLILSGDEIHAINTSVITDQKDMSLELLSFAGYTGELNLTLKRSGIGEYFDVGVLVNNFLPNSESQSNPLESLGINVDYKMRPIVGGIEKSGPAYIAGIRSNDQITKIGNTEIKYASDIRESVISKPNENVLVDVYRDNRLMQIPLNIGSIKNQNGEDIGVIGISFGTQRSVIESFMKGVYETYNLSVKTLQFIGKMLSGNMGTDNLSGPIGIAQMAGDTAQAGFIPFMYLMALLSISLGVLNLLPIPVLDGGQLTLLGIEAVRGKPLAEKTENFIYTGGALIVGALMIFAVFNDVSRFF